MQPSVAVLVLGVAAVVAFWLDLHDADDPNEGRASLCRIGGGIACGGALVLAADWFVEHALRSFGGAAAGSGWVTASVAVLEQLLRAISGVLLA